jgi:gliding motility-associated-like protein
MDHADIYKDDSLVGTLWYINHSSELTLGGHGAGSAANQFNNPDGLFVDTALAIYVSDAANNRVLKFDNMTTTGVMVAGGNGAGNAANQLNNPGGIYVDVNANVYVVDRGNNRIQKWAPGAAAGVTVAGGNGAGAGLNQLDGPVGLYVDVNGNIYVADQNNNRIQKWAPGAASGVTVAGGNGAGAAANQFNGPVGVSVDATGNIYVADENNNRIQKWAPGATSGVTVAGGNGVGAGASQLDGPDALFMDAAGDIYVSDINNNRIQEWTPGSTRGITVAGGNVPNYSGSAFNHPTAVFVDAVGRITVALAGTANSVQRWGYAAVPFFSPDYDPELTGNGSYTAVVTDIYGCTANTNPVQVTDYVMPSVLISTDTTTISLCTTAVFTAMPNYPGPMPVFQWAVNGVPAGANNPSFSTNILQNGDTVTCLLTSNDSCLVTQTVTSNTIHMTVVNVNPPTIRISESTNGVCEGTPVDFVAAVTNGNADPVFQWRVDNINEGTNSPNYSSSNLKNGDLISCSITDDSSCVLANSNSITMIINSAPVIAPNQSFTYTPGKSLVLDPVVSGDVVKYLWTPAEGLSSDTIQNPNASPSKTTDYKLTVTASDGCHASGDILVKVFTKISIPNVFSPNGDGKNDIFYVLGNLAGAIVQDFSVFDRWGERVFHVNDIYPGDPAYGWNGYYKGLPAVPGTYVYIITIKLSDNSTQVYKGTVILIR